MFLRSISKALHAALRLRCPRCLWSVFGVAFPLFFFRYSKSLWLAFDYLVNPEEPDLRVVRRWRI